MLHRRVRIMALLGLAFGLAAPLLAQDESDVEQARLRGELDKKLKQEFVAKGGWVLDYDVARQRAKDENKLLFIYFSRTYAP